MKKRRRHLSLAGKLLIVAIVLVLAVTAVIAGSMIKGKQETEVSTSQQTSVQQDSEKKEEKTKIDPDKDDRFFNTDSDLIIANKKHKLPDGYVPSDLVSLTVTTAYGDVQLKQEAADAIAEMFAAANNEGIYPVVTTAYRSEDFQSQLYYGYVEKDGQEAADTYSSRPGYSDHQTGLAADISCDEIGYELDTSFEDTAEGQWLARHAHEYGFVMRYPQGKQDVTGYTYEPWHFRYIGVQNATDVYETDVDESIEEYYGIAGGDYEE